MNNMQTFFEVYAHHLEHAALTNPVEYSWPPSQARAIARKMTIALSNGTANKDGQACRATCKELRIPYTYKGIRAYFDADDAPITAAFAAVQS